MATLAPSLVIARGRINQKWPHRDHSSDGWIGNKAHQAVASDHNPDARGVVHAIDVDRDGIHVPTVLAAFMLSPATHYLIHNRRIWSAKDRFAPHRYIGDDPHTGHIHESVWHTSFSEHWAGGWSPITGWPNPLDVRLGSTGEAVRLVQAYSNAFWYALKVDGDFGPATDKAVRAFQKRAGIEVDGVVGPQTRHKYATLPR